MQASSYFITSLILHYLCHSAAFLSFFPSPLYKNSGKNQAPKLHQTLISKTLSKRSTNCKVGNSLKAVLQVANIVSKHHISKKKCVKKVLKQEKV